MVTLNHAVAVAMTRGPRAALELLETLDGDDRMVRHHRLHTVRGYLLELAGDDAGARESYQLAARRTTSLPEQRYRQTAIPRAAARTR
jgi:predicted RNA polymerase sigma factor